MLTLLLNAHHRRVRVVLCPDSDMRPAENPSVGIHVPDCYVMKFRALSGANLTIWERTHGTTFTLGEPSGTPCSTSVKVRLRVTSTSPSSATNNDCAPADASHQLLRIQATESNRATCREAKLWVKLLAHPLISDCVGGTYTERMHTIPGHHRVGAHPLPEPARSHQVVRRVETRAGLRDLWRHDCH